MNDSLPLIRPLLHRQNHVPNRLQSVIHVLIVLDLPRGDERRDRFVELCIPFWDEAIHDKAVECEGFTNNLEEVLQEGVKGRVRNENAPKVGVLAELTLIGKL